MPPKRLYLSALHKSSGGPQSSIAGNHSSPPLLSVEIALCVQIEQSCLRSSGNLNGAKE